MTVNGETKDLFELKVGNYLIRREALVAFRTNGWLHGDVSLNILIKSSFIEFFSLSRQLRALWKLFLQKQT